MRRRSLADDERAAVYVEFLVVIMPLFLLFLAMVQISMLFTAKLVVNHSAYRAARSAIVVLPDHPERYGDAAKDTVNFNETSSGDIVPSTLSSFAEFLGIDIPDNFFSRGDSRINMVRIAASIPLLGLAPSPTYLEQTLGVSFGPDGQAAESVQDAIGFTGRSGDGMGARAFMGLLYTATAMSVTFPPAPGAAATTNGGVTPARHTRGSTTRLTTRVTYSYACAVPGAAALICDGWNSLSGQNGGAGRDELNGAPARGLGLVASRGYYYALRSEETMTYHGADYY